MKCIIYLFKKPTQSDAIQVFLEYCFHIWLFLDLVKQKPCEKKLNDQERKKVLLLIFLSNSVCIPALFFFFLFPLINVELSDLEGKII